VSDQGGVCPRCETAYQPGQEYCLECGLRRGAEPDASAPEQPEPAPPPKPKPNRTWIWAALGGLVVAAAGAAVAIAVTGHGGTKTLTMTTTIAPVTTTAPPATDTGAVAPRPATTATITTGPAPTVPAPPKKPPAKPALIVWPGHGAYTAVLVSLPAPGGHAAALARAHQALAKGLPQVGVLDSKDFASLNPGYYVVFSGIYKTLIQAEAGARNARFAGFGSAYPRQIVP
jgi:hypothetical protein